MAEELKAGDVVVLKSGGVKMTIEYLDDTEADCVWFDGSSSKEKSFALVALKKYEEPNPSSFLS